jgi:hypothetical protein
MAGRKRTKERRKHKRYHANEGAYAAISPRSYKIGQIVDISMGGLSFKYIDTSEFDDDSDFDYDKDKNPETIFLSSMGYYVGDLTFDTVADYKINNTPSFSHLTIRKRHIKFLDLELKQLFDLDYYIQKNGKKSAEL